jgi:hypothetical protein
MVEPSDPEDTLDLLGSAHEDESPPAGSRVSIQRDDQPQATGIEERYAAEVDEKDRRLVLEGTDLSLDLRSGGDVELTGDRHHRRSGNLICCDRDLMHPPPRSPSARFI